MAVPNFKSDVCSVKDCSKAKDAKGLCPSHYYRMKTYGDPTHVNPTQHGQSRSKEFAVWWSMLQRCTNKNLSTYRYYGARGIKVCDAWLSFTNFINDMGKRPSAEHSLDRIDNNGNYEPSNCRWTDWSTQCANSRQKPNKTGHRGVYYYKQTNRWVARIMVNYQKIHIGYYSTPELASETYKAKYLELRGQRL